MHLAIIHISDIHLTAGSNHAVTRIPQLAGALRSALSGIQHYIVAVTGDVARTGAQAEYEVAERFFSRLTNWIRDELKPDTLHVVFVPGNHDCNFLDASELREMILQKAPDYIDSLDPGGEFVSTCLSVQQQFFIFEAGLQSRSGTLNINEQLHHREVFTIGGRVIRLECFNTAWLSRKHEVQGSLLFPIGAIATYDANVRTDLVVSLLHHPYSWLDATNRREFQRYVERTSDVVLTGHEHETDHFRKELSTGDVVQYVEGAVFQGSDPNVSGFNVMLLDLEAGNQTQITYGWHADRYERVSEAGPRLFTRNRLVTVGAFENNPMFVHTLSDPERAYHHPFKSSLTLGDIYVYPDVRQRSLEKFISEPDQQPTVIKSENLLPYVVSKRLLLLTGERDIGKTALARTLYADFQHLHGLVPLLISGEDIKATNDLSRLMKLAFSDQYTDSLYEAYRQLPADRRVIILDDFHLARLNQKGRAQFIKACRGSFGSVIVFADDLFGFDELSAREGRSATPFDEFDHCEIQTFGHVLRHRLIRKWVMLGRELQIDDRDIAHEVSTKEGVLNALIGKNVIPPLPVLLLIILQAAESSRGANLVSGAYGYYYEVLITEALDLVSTDITETGGKYTYLSRLAHHMFSVSRELITEDEVESVTSAYANEYRSPVKHDLLLEQLIRSEILRRVDGSISFRYRYYYYYFVARYFKDAVADPSQERVARHRLYELAKHVFFEPYANILIFYLYLTKDIELINVLLAASKCVFAEYKPCDFDTDIEAINELFYAPPKRELESAGNEESREEYLSRLDGEETGGSSPVTAPLEPEKVEYSEALDLSLKFNFAFKLLQLLGQIIKNFPGELKGDLKLDIARECYRMGLRALNAFIGISSEHRDEIKAFIEFVLRERARIRPDEKMLPSSERVLLGMSLAAGFGIVKRISYAVGHEQLRLTHADVLEAEGQNLATSIIDMSIKLDYFSKNVPRPALEELEQRVRDNPYCYTILQDLVFLYLYLFPASFSEKQSLGKLVGIKVRDMRLLESRLKKLSS